jgi:HEPN domain-containing protein
MPQPALGIAAYHCQQAAEKLVKGLLVVAGVGFPRTHDLLELAGRAAPFYSDLSSLLGALGPLTVWSVAYRYPGSKSTTNLTPASWCCKTLWQ